ncbi:hypothetical protein Pan216_46740 [Planctomycetes bacterium Pan216]|uniref:Uncharacterized protein n=1 Tax=Kolteria novifilia TaxID=2527975 RepID=A0A518BA48_9BACT|nr:hypothetical protein Pan216_46740 [Planctomycetes bacterium Pan216]
MASCSGTVGPRPISPDPHGLAEDAVHGCDRMMAEFPYSTEMRE